MKGGKPGRAGQIAIILVASACGVGGGGTGEGEVSVVATTSILGDLVGRVVGDRAAVEVLIPVGVDAHDYQASARQAAAVEEADLVVAIGLGLEPGLEDLLEAREAGGPRVLRLGPALDPIPLPEGGFDPHVWMDPMRMAEGARMVAAALAAVAPGVDWAASAEDYARQLELADTRIRGILAEVAPGERKMVTNHEAFAYFAEAYDFEILGTVIPGTSTLAEPSSEELTALVELIETEGVTAIFAETTRPALLAQALAAEVEGQVQVVELYTESLGEPGSGANTLIGMLVVNAERIAAALG